MNLSAHPAPIIRTTREYAKLPVYEEVRIGTSQAIQILFRPSLVLRKSFELSPNPLDEIPVDIPPKLPQARGVESSVVCEPALKYGIEHPR